MFPEKSVSREPGGGGSRSQTASSILFYPSDRHPGPPGTSQSHIVFKTIQLHLGILYIPVLPVLPNTIN